MLEAEREGGSSRRSGTPSARAPAAAAQARARHVASAAKTQLIVLAVVARCISPNVLAKGGALVALARAAKAHSAASGLAAPFFLLGFTQCAILGPLVGIWRFFNALVEHPPIEPSSEDRKRDATGER